MDVGTILLIVMGVFFLLLAAETPIAFVLAASGGLGIYLLRDDIELVTAAFSNIPYSATANYSYASVTMFILLGMFALHGRLAERTYRLASDVFGRFQGGLGVATVAACAGFAAVSGSSVATAATVGKLSVTEMVRNGYPRRLAAGLVAGAGTLGILIPPSIIMVFYAILAQISIGNLLLAGIVPGILSAIVFGTYVATRGSVLIAREQERLGALRLEGALAVAGGTSARIAQPARLTPAAGAVGAGDVPENASDAVKDLAGSPGAPAAAEETPDLALTTSRASQLRAVLWIAVLFAIVMTGVFTGQFTVVESGAIGAVVAMLMMVFETRREGIRQLGRHFGNALSETASLAAMCFAILIGAMIFTQFLVMARVPQDFTEWITGLNLPPMMIVIVILAALVPLGMALDEMSIVIITVPLIAPAVAELGYDPIWFAILFVKLMEIGLIAPPVGLNVFVVAGASGTSVEDTYRGVIPFILLDMVIVAILIIFPDLVTWLPDLIGQQA